MTLSVAQEPLLPWEIILHILSLTDDCLTLVHAESICKDLRRYPPVPLGISLIPSPTPSHIPSPTPPHSTSIPDFVWASVYRRQIPDCVESRLTSTSDREKEPIRSRCLRFLQVRAYARRRSASYLHQCRNVSFNQKRQYWRNYHRDPVLATQAINVESGNSLMFMGSTDKGEVLVGNGRNHIVCERPMSMAYEDFELVDDVRINENLVASSERFYACVNARDYHRVLTQVVLYKRPAHPTKALAPPSTTNIRGTTRTRPVSPSHGRKLKTVIIQSQFLCGAWFLPTTTVQTLLCEHTPNGNRIQHHDILYLLGFATEARRGIYCIQ